MESTEDFFETLSPFDLNTWLNFSDGNKDTNGKSEDLVLNLPGKAMTLKN